jgi:hypothetical protein
MHKMKSNKYVLCGMLIAMIAVCCSKNNYQVIKGGTSFTMVDAIPGSNNVVTNFNGAPSGKVPDTLHYFNSALQISYGSYQELSGYVGKSPLSISYITDTGLSVWNGVLNLSLDSIYSLFFTGADTLHVDTMFTADIPLNHSITDSTVGIRFVNLSTGSDPISVNLEGSPNGSEVTSLSYKQITGFKDYSSNSNLTNGGYLFVFKDLVTGDSLTSFSISGNGTGPGLADPNNGNLLVFKNVTVALIGQPGVNANVRQSVILVDNY